jgi:K+-sensing histidine kinase KdpD
MSDMIPSRVLAATLPRPARFRDRQFWWTQGLVAAAAVAVYGFDGLIERDLLVGGLHDIPVMLFLVPVLYAALAYGREGAVLTALWSAVIVAPHSWLVSHEQYEWLGDLGTMLTVMVAGMFLAVRTEAEREARRRAEEVSDRLRLLNELGAVFDRPLAVPMLLQELADRLSDGLRLDSVWVRHSDGAEGDVVFARSGNGDAGAVDAASAAALVAQAAGRLPP